MGDVEKRREVREKEAPTNIVKRIVNIIFTLAGFILLFRLVFLLFGANPDNGFVDVIYSITEPYVSIFSGIFADSEFGSGFFEPATLIALVVLFIVSWLIQSIFSSRTVRREEYIPAERNDDAETRQNVRREETVRKETVNDREERDHNERVDDREESTRKETVREDHDEEKSRR